jgi:hypothetical protein
MAGSTKVMTAQGTQATSNHGYPKENMGMNNIEFLTE